MATPENLKSLKVDELRKELRRRSLKSSGRKAELQARLHEALEEEFKATEDTPQTDQAEGEGGSGKAPPAADDDRGTAEAEHDAGRDDNAEDAEAGAKTAEPQDREQVDENAARQESTAEREPTNQKAEHQPEQVDQTQTEPGSVAAIKDGTVATQGDAVASKAQPGDHDDDNEDDETRDSSAVAAQGKEGQTAHATAQDVSMEPSKKEAEQVDIVSTRVDVVDVMETDFSEEPLQGQQQQAAAEDDGPRMVHIKNLRRPFTIMQLKDLLMQTGNIDGDDGFSIDNIRSQCVVTYESHQQAKQTVAAVHGLKWPEPHGIVLSADFTDEDVIKAGKAPPTRVPKHKARRDEARQADLPPSKRTKADDAAADKQEEPVKTLDDLFKKTTTTPHIYYLQGSPEQLEAAARDRERRDKARRERNERIQRGYRSRSRGRYSRSRSRDRGYSR